MTTKLRHIIANWQQNVAKVITRRRLIATALTVAFVVPAVAYAQGALSPGLASAGDLGLPSAPGDGGIEDIRLIIARGVQFLLGFVGLIAVGVVIYGGYLWMTSAGNTDQVTEAKTVLRNGAIGLAIIILSFAIVTFVINFFTNNALNNGSSGNPGFQGCRNCISRGGGLVDDVYPDQGDRVPRDVNILVTFAEEVLVVPAGDTEENNSFILNAEEGAAGNTCEAGWWCGDNNPAKFEIRYTSPDGSSITYDQFKVYTRDKLTFRIDPVDLMGLEVDGSAIETPTEALISNINLESGKNPAPGLIYGWSFTVTTQIDNKPPRVIEFTPKEGNLSTRDDTVLIRFDEPVDPLSSTGVQDADASNSGYTFDNIIVYADDTNDSVVNYVQVDGEFLLGNGYTDVWFVPESVCLDSDGNPIRNSCNFEKYCLPANADIRVVTKAAKLKTDPSCIGQPSSKPAEACFPFDGVADMSSNSLDGSRGATPDLVPSGDGVANGPSGNPQTDALNTLGDTFAWEYKTNDQVFISPPVITNMSPLPDKEGVDINAPFIATFNRTLLPARTFKINDVIYKPVRMYQQTDPVTDTWANYRGGYSIRQSNVKACSANTDTLCSRDSECAGETNYCRSVCGNDPTVSCVLDSDCGGDDKCGVSNLNINHSGLIDPNRSLEAQVTYEPRIGSTIQDRWQNCFYLPTTVPTIANDIYGSPLDFDKPNVSVNEVAPPVFDNFTP